MTVRLGLIVAAFCTFSLLVCWWPVQRKLNQFDGDYYHLELLIRQKQGAVRNGFFQRQYRQLVGQAIENDHWILSNESPNHLVVHGALNGWRHPVDVIMGELPIMYGPLRQWSYVEKGEEFRLELLF